MSTSAASGARPERPPWAPIIEQIERALAGWLERTVVPLVSSAVPDSPPDVSENTAFEQRLVQIEAALENAGRQSRETDAALEAAVAELARWRERAAALHGSFSPSPQRGEEDTPHPRPLSPAGRGEPEVAEAGPGSIS
jgi:hypothetical protein